MASSSTPSTTGLFWQDNIIGPTIFGANIFPVHTRLLKDMVTAVAGVILIILGVVFMATPDLSQIAKQIIGVVHLNKAVK